MAKPSDTDKIVAAILTCGIMSKHDYEAEAYVAEYKRILKEVGPPDRKPLQISDDFLKYAAKKPERKASKR